MLYTFREPHFFTFSVIFSHIASIFTFSVEFFTFSYLFTYSGIFTFEGATDVKQGKILATIRRNVLHVGGHVEILVVFSDVVRA